MKPLYIILITCFIAGHSHAQDTIRLKGVTVYIKGVSQKEGIPLQKLLNGLKVECSTPGFVIKQFLLARHGMAGGYWQMPIKGDSISPEQIKMLKPGEDMTFFIELVLASKDGRNYYLEPFFIAVQTTKKKKYPARF